MRTINKRTPPHRGAGKHMGAAPPWCRQAKGLHPAVGQASKEGPPHHGAGKKRGFPDFLESVESVLVLVREGD